MRTGRHVGPGWRQGLGKDVGFPWGGVRGSVGGAYRSLGEPGERGPRPVVGPGAST
ncbi:MAG: hypothetical protein ACQGVC_25765 [Myxococcota bacterium]